MKIIGSYNVNNKFSYSRKNSVVSSPNSNAAVLQQEDKKYAQIPLNYKYGNIIYNNNNKNFDPNENIGEIEYEDYKNMSESKKEHIRELYNFFQDRKDISKLAEIAKDEDVYLPLRSEGSVEDFLDVAKWYSKFKDQKIICLGRSPKWFLTASQWMKGGISDYRYCAFSGYWYYLTSDGDVVRMDGCAPTEEEYEAYKQYLTENKFDPKSLTEEAEKTGKKIVITDYIETGKGMTSFLDLMSRFAEEQGVLKEFCESIEIAKIGSHEYTIQRLRLDDYDDETLLPSQPDVVFPDRMKKYLEYDYFGHCSIPQHYYDMGEGVFEEMLYNQVPSECRSTYYPHNAWTKFDPRVYMTNRLNNLDEVPKLLSHISSHSPISDFPPILRAYRNLLSFRILDALEQRNLLRDDFETKRLGC